MTATCTFPRSSSSAARSARSRPSRSTGRCSTRWWRPRASRRRRTTRGRGASWSIDTDAAKTALALGMGERWRADLTADGVAAARVDELVRGVAHQDHERARARARLPHLGRPRPLPRRDAPARRVGHGAAVARRRGREPHAERDRRRARVVLGRGADLLPGGGTRRARSSPPSGCRTRSCSSATPIPRYVGAGRGRRSRSTSSARQPVGAIG